MTESTPPPSVEFTSAVALPALVADSVDVMAAIDAAVDRIDDPNQLALFDTNDATVTVHPAHRAFVTSTLATVRA